MIYTLTIDDDPRPPRFDTLDGTVRALQAMLDGLPLDPAQAEAYEFFLSDPARVQAYLDTSGAFELQFSAGGRQHTAVIRPK